MRWRCGEKLFTCGAGAAGEGTSASASALVMGVVNVTPDSFSDGGRYLSGDEAVKCGLALMEDGADIIDVGGESTRPGASPVSEEEEKRRILPVIERLAQAGAVVSADTMKPGVMRAALQHGAALINDVNGFRADGAIDAVQKSDCGLVIMHMQGKPAVMQHTPQYDDVVGEVGSFLQARLTALQNAGIAAERLCIDPGIGFGKTAAHNKTLLANLSSFSFGRPLLIGVSRKSLFSGIAKAADGRDIASAAAAALLVARGANIVRVHNVQVTRQALAAGELLRAHG